MAATRSSPSTRPRSSTVASTAPATVPAAPIRKISRKQPVSFRILRILVCSRSSGMASGTA